jgi:hypothetical protein
VTVRPEAPAELKEQQEQQVAKQTTASSESAK